MFRPFRKFFRQNLTADDHAFIADIDPRSRDEFGNIGVVFAAKRTATGVLGLLGIHRVDLAAIILLDATLSQVLLPRVEKLVIKVLGEDGAANLGLGGPDPLVETRLRDLQHAVSNTESFPENPVGRTGTERAFILLNPLLSLLSALDVLSNQIGCIGTHVRVCTDGAGQIVGGLAAPVSGNLDIHDVAVASHLKIAR